MRPLLALAVLATFIICGEAHAFGKKKPEPTPAPAPIETPSIFKILKKLEKPVSAETFVNILLQADAELLKGANPNERNSKGATPLMIMADWCLSVESASNAQTRFVQNLIARGADVMATTPDTGETALHRVFCSIEVAKALVNAGASAEALDKVARTPLHSFMALRFSGSELNPYRVETANFLSGLYGRLDMQDMNGETPLMLAMPVTNLAEAEALLASGKDAGLNLKRKDGRSAFDLALHFDRPFAMRLLSAGARPDAFIGDEPRLNVLAQEGDYQLFRAFLDLGYSPNVRNSAGTTPLMVSVRYKHYEMVRTLIERKAIVTLPDQDGYTALHLAASLGDYASSHQLLLAKADANARTWKRVTPLMAAIESEQLPLVILLLDNGACINVIDDAGRTPMAIAVQRSSAIEAELRARLAAGQNTCGGAAPVGG